MRNVKIFISHRHDDSKIASVVSRHLQEWGVSGDDIFQSSDPKRGLTFGNSIKEELQDRLKEVNLLILVYTYSDEDWSNCMWECGIAQGQSTVETRTIVFQCTDDEPTVFKSEMRVVVNPKEILRIADEFHTKPDFLPQIEGVDGSKEQKEGIFSETSGGIIKTRAERLYVDLKQVIPTGVPTSKHLWDFVRLKLNGHIVRKLNSLEDEKNIKERIKGHLELRHPTFIGIGNSVDTAVRQFGYGSWEDNLKLSDLICRWEKENETCHSEWIENLYDAVVRAITNTPSAPVSGKFKSVREGVDWWFLPTVTRMRGYRDDSVEFDVYLIRVPPLDEKITKVPTRKKAINKKRTSKKAATRSTGSRKEKTR